ncbi:MAG: hypothetical protein LBQ61_07380 [Spirochaetales bacterium]|nr:hypothetical protein [Spirochaetales bacterium]
MSIETNPVNSGSTLLPTEKTPHSHLIELVDIKAILYSGVKVDVAETEAGPEHRVDINI